MRQRSSTSTAPRLFGMWSQPRSATRRTSSAPVLTVDIQSFICDSFDPGCEPCRYTLRYLSAKRFTRCDDDRSASTRISLYQAHGTSARSLTRRWRSIRNNAQQDRLMHQLAVASSTPTGTGTTFWRKRHFIQGIHERRRSYV